VTVAATATTNNECGDPTFAPTSSPTKSPTNEAVQTLFVLTFTIDGEFNESEYITALQATTSGSTVQVTKTEYTVSATYSLTGVVNQTTALAAFHALLAVSTNVTVTVTPRSRRLGDEARRLAGTDVSMSFVTESADAATSAKSQAAVPSDLKQKITDQGGDAGNVSAPDVAVAVAVFTTVISPQGEMDVNATKVANDASAAIPTTMYTGVVGVSNVVAITTAPSTAPTYAPTGAPTKSPTNSPTKSPTGAPTKSPTAAPSTAGDGNNSGNSTKAPGGGTEEESSAYAMIASLPCLVALMMSDMM